MINYPSVDFWKGAKFSKMVLVPTKDFMNENICSSQ